MLVLVIAQLKATAVQPWQPAAGMSAVDNPIWRGCGTFSVNELTVNDECTALLLKSPARLGGEPGTVACTAHVRYTESRPRAGLMIPVHQSHRVSIVVYRSKSSMRTSYHTPWPTHPVSCSAAGQVRVTYARFGPMRTHSLASASVHQPGGTRRQLNGAVRVCAHCRYQCVTRRVVNHLTAVPGATVARLASRCCSVLCAVLHLVSGCILPRSSDFAAYSARFAAK
jgi:hypothetical protein